MTSRRLLEPLVAAGLGLAASYGFPPWGLAPLTLLAVAGLGLIAPGVSKRRAAFLAWVMFTAWHFAALAWVSEAFLVKMPAMGVFALAPVLGLAAGLALFPTVTVYLWRRFWPNAAGGGAAAMLGLAVALSAAEWLTGHLFTGFPWAMTSLAAAETSLSQSVASFGAYGLGLVLLAAPLTVAGAVRTAVRTRAAPPGAFALAAGTALLLGLTWTLHPSPGAAPPLAADRPIVRLVQGNTAQREKWKPANRSLIFARHMSLTNAPAPRPLAAAIWPETATPFPVDQVPTAMSAIGAAAEVHGLVLLGAPLRHQSPAGTQHTNSLIAVDGSGAVVGRYDKAHLVPGGEYVPFQDYLPFGKLVAGGSFTPGPGITTMRLPGLPPFSPLICYEVIFPGAVALDDDRPEWLVNITNDAWYGVTPGPYQHLAITRLRAIEEGLPLVRVANTGVSAAFDGKGRELGRIPLNETGFLDVALPPPEPPTLYARHGDLIYGAMLLILAALGLLAGRRDNA